MALMAEPAIAAEISLDGEGGSGLAALHSPPSAPPVQRKDGGKGELRHMWQRVGQIQTYARLHNVEQWAKLGQLNHATVVHTCTYIQLARVRSIYLFQVSVTGTLRSNTVSII